MPSKDFMGVYTFEHAGGSFDVHLRSQERFFAPKFQAKATWHMNLEMTVINIDWGKFGKYELTMTDAGTKAFSGSAVGKPESWRKMHLKRPFTEAELKLMDSKWNFMRACRSYPLLRARRA
jgi:hypothetical protein